MQELRHAQELRGAAVREADEILAGARGAKRDLTESETRRLEAIKRQIFEHDRTISACELELRQLTGTGGFSAGDMRDIRRFSLARAIATIVSDRALDGVEAELHAEGVQLARSSGIVTEGNLTVPDFVFAERRDMTATGGSNGNQGGTMVGTETATPISPLYARTVLRTLGARLLTGLTSNVAIPSIGTTTIGHKPETGTLDESSPATSQISLQPNRIGTFVEVSKQLIIQTGDEIERLIRGDLLENLALAMENGAINGSGADNQPVGLLHSSSGIDFTSVVGGTDGAAPDWSHIVGLETAVATRNADIERLGYLTNPAVRGKLKTSLKAATSDQFIWPETARTLNGLPVAVSSLIPSTLDKGGSTGACSAIIYGNWDDLIVATWGGLDILVNPYIKDIDGLVRITANAFYDTAIRRPASFAAMIDALA